ncbi:hypothetical protein jhhlp_005731 [Lomentospora prolificans]|uniref:Uncharacterized protein n=1 Tax=Lomentospora prolificans TaxID=41688 RepID=A0A2N3N3W9_9PEZI|nr:hypothetical protein jhhlp_005731 [Lomentospora prolificans]
MGRHRAHARFDRAQWRLRFLVPLWVLQLLLSIAVLALFATTLQATLRSWKDGKEHEEGFPLLIVVWKSSNLALGVVAPSLVIFEIFRFVQETLTPRTVLTTQFITFGFAVAALVLGVIVHVQGRLAPKDTIIGLVLSSIAIASSLTPALYALRSHRRLAAYDELTYPTNTKPYGFFADPESQQQLDRSSRASIISTLSGETIPSARRLSSASSLLSLRRLSGSAAISPMTPPTVTRTVSVTSVPIGASRPDPVPLQNLSRSHSVYNHERDTQFDDYVNAKRNSQLSFRDHIDHAFGADMGWNVGASPSTLADQLNRKGSVVNSGTLESGNVIVARVPSSSAHSLGAVPEEAEGEMRSDTKKEEEEERVREGLLDVDKYGREVSP